MAREREQGGRFLRIELPPPAPDCDPTADWRARLALATPVLRPGGGGPSLVPTEAQERMRLFGLAHELLGENGLVWSSRVLVIHRGLATGGSSIGGGGPGPALFEIEREDPVLN